MHFLVGLICLSIIYSPAKASAANLKAIGTSKTYETTEYQNRIQFIVDEVDRQRPQSLIIQVNGIWDYEPAYAMTQYLNYWNSKLPMYLLVEIPAVSSDFEQRLLDQLNSKSALGDSNWGLEPFDPSIEGDHYCITFNGATPNSQHCSN